MTEFTKMTRRTAVGLAAAAALTTAAPAFAGSDSVDMSGKTIEWTIPFSEKGGSAKWAFFFAPLLSEALPGNPTVVVKFMPGAGSTKGANWFQGQTNGDATGLFGSPGRGDRAPARLSDLFPAFRDRLDEPIAGYSASAVVALAPDAVFLATPHEASLGLVAELRARAVRVFDLSGAFRLPNTCAYSNHYGFEHTQPGLLKSAVYGLAELNRDQSVGAPLVAVPGCYPTSAILPLAPLVHAGAVKPGTAPIIDSISGVSGAGRSASVNTRFCEVSVQPYNVMHHRHQPEIEHHAGVRVVFTPHIGPYDRGIVSTIHI